MKNNHQRHRSGVCFIHRQAYMKFWCGTHGLVALRRFATCSKKESRCDLLKKEKNEEMFKKV